MQLADNELLAIVKGDNVLHMAVLEIIFEGQRLKLDGLANNVALRHAHYFQRGLVGKFNFLIVAYHQHALVHIFNHG